MPDPNFDQTLADATTKLLAARKEWESSHNGTSLPFSLEDQLVQKWSNGLFKRSDIDTYLSKVVMPAAQSPGAGIKNALAGLSMNLGPLAERFTNPPAAAQDRMVSAARNEAMPGPAFLENAAPQAAMGLVMGPIGGARTLAGKVLSGALFGGGGAAVNSAAQAPEGQVLKTLAQDAPAIAASTAVGAGVPLAAGAVQAGVSAIKKGGVMPAVNDWAAWRQIGKQLTGTTEGELASNQQLYQQTGRGDITTPADLAPDELQSLAQRAAGRSASTRAQLRKVTTGPMGREMGASNDRLLGDIQNTIGAPYAPEIEQAMEAEQKVRTNPMYQAARENGPDVQLTRSVPFKVGEALGPSAKPEAQTALAHAMRTNKDFYNKFVGPITNAQLNPEQFGTAIPGSAATPNAITAILTDPEVSLAIPRGVAEAAHAGQSVPFAKLVDAYHDLDRTVGGEFRRGGNYAKAFRLAQARSAFGDELTNLSPDWAKANMAFARTARQQEAFLAGFAAAGEGHPGAVEGAMAKYADTPGPVTRGLQAAFHEAAGRAGDAGDVIKPTAPFKRDVLAYTFPRNTAAPIMAANQAESQMAGLHPVRSSADNTLKGFVPSRSPLWNLFKIAGKMSTGGMREGTAASLGNILLKPGPEAQAKFLKALDLWNQSH